jgi:chaperonin GroEL (HSP60 family)
MENSGVIEPLAVKVQAIKSATEAASMILRIDDVIASAKGGAPGGGMPSKPGPGGAGDFD